MLPVKIVTICISLFAFAPSAGATHILVYGDSLSAAYNMPIEAGWVALLARDLKGEHRVSNASITNEGSGGGLARLPQTLAALEPDVVLLELGAVDGLRGQSLAMIRGNLDKMITLIEDSGARVLIGGIRIPANYGPRYTDSFRSMYEDIAEERGLPFIQLYIESIGYNPDLMQRDGVHPREEAQPMVKDHVKKFLLSEGII